MLQWSREARRYIEGETIANCWVKADILPVLQANELRGEGNIKAKRGAAKFKQAYDELSEALTSIGLTDDTNVDDIIHPDIEIVDDSNRLMIYDEEEDERTMEGDNNANNEEDDEEDDDADDDLNVITLTKAKEYATALHHFVVDNMGQNKQLLELSEASCKMAQEINRMVTSASTRQRMVSDYFTPNTSSTVSTSTTTE